LAALLGNDAGGLSASTITRLKEVWSQEHVRSTRRDLSTKRYVYFWVDGIHVQAPLEDEAQCLLVISGATPECKKELVCLSAPSWWELLLDLERRGVTMGPGRRRARLLAGGRASVAEDARPRLLGTQHRQCAQQITEEHATEGQAGAAGDLDGRDQEK
jgi:hypothetical protein